MKIINILPTHPPRGFFSNVTPEKLPLGLSEIDKKNADRVDFYPYWIIYDFTDGFHSRMSQSLLALDSSLEIECWGLYEFIDEIFVKDIEGIKFKLFPARYKKSFLGSSVLESYDELIQTLNLEIKDEKPIIHLHGIHNPSMHPIYMKCNLSKVPVVGTQRGGISPYFSLAKKPWKITKYLIEQMNFPNIDFFFAQSLSEVSYLSKKYGFDKVLHFQDGIDISKIKAINKEKARKKLGISLSTKMLLYVGHFSSNKPAKNLLSSFPALQSKGFDLYMIGGFKGHDLYDSIKTHVPNSFDRMDINELILYYSAADIHVYPSDDPLFVNFSSISNANMESLACNLPIYTSQMIHFLGDSIEKKAIGVDSGICKSEEKMINDLVDMYENKNRYVDCRKIANKYYNRRHNVSKIKEIYIKLNQKYKLQLN